MKTAFIFSGQGAQYPLMGKELYDNFKEAKEVFDSANKTLGFNITDICFEENNAKLNETEYTQPAILTTSIAILKVLESKGIKPDMVAGLSLGEYAALVSSGVISFEDCVKLVNKRGKFMTEAVPSGVGAMAAILGMDSDKLLEVCEKANGYCTIANYNCPGQLVIGGEKDAVKEACTLATEAGAKRAIELNVSGPFHTKLLEPAAKKLRVELDKVSFNDPKIPVVMNVNAKELNGSLVELLEKQVMSSVLWEDSINYMISNNIERFIEVGPGKTLSGFMRKIDKTKTILNVEDIKSLEKTLEKLEV